MLRLQRRDAIVDAARSLAAAHGSDGFTVDQVAQLAGVSRRTVFNHFATVDDLLVAACQQILAEATTAILERVDATLGAGPGDDEAGGRAALDAVGEAARGVDLPTAITTIHRMLGCPEPEDERAQRISRTAFDHVGGLLRERLHTRPGLDPVDLELGLALLFAGIVTITALWLDAHPDLPATVPARARRDWDDLLDRLLLRLRTGTAG